MKILANQWKSNTSLVQTSHFTSMFVFNTQEKHFKIFNCRMNQCSKSKEIKNDYSWTSDSKTPLRGRMALVYCDNPSEKIAKVKTALDKLEFDTRIRTISEENLVIISQEGIVQKTIKFFFFFSNFH